MADPTSDVVLPSPCLVVLVGPSGSGKSTWAQAHFPPDQIVSSDRLRAVVGEGEEDLAASEDAFALLEQIVEHRLAAPADHGRRHARPRRRTAGELVGRAARRARRGDRVRRVRDAGRGECRARNRARGQAGPGRVLSPAGASGCREHAAGARRRGLRRACSSPTTVRTAPRADGAGGPARRAAGRRAGRPPLRAADPGVLVAGRAGGAAGPADRRSPPAPRRPASRASG